MSWLDDITQEVARAAETGASVLDLSADVRREILDLARIASHSSGDRINAPLLCYVIGIAVGRGASLEAIAAVVRESTA